MTRAFKIDVRPRQREPLDHTTFGIITNPASTELLRFVPDGLPDQPVLLFRSRRVATDYFRTVVTHHAEQFTPRPTPGYLIVTPVLREDLTAHPYVCVITRDAD